jgi:hypothetical protein
MLCSEIVPNGARACKASRCCALLARGDRLEIVREALCRRPQSATFLRREKIFFEISRAALERARRNLSTRAVNATRAIAPHAARGCHLQQTLKT